MSERLFTIRISDEMHAEVKRIAHLRRVSMAHVIREALDEYIERRKRDPEFQARLGMWWCEQETLYRRLVA